MQCSVAGADFIRTCPAPHSKRLLPGGAVNRLGVQQAGEHFRGNLNQEAPVSAIYIYRGKRLDAAFDKHRQTLARAKRRSASD